MPTQQGDVALIHDPVAQQLLQSSLPAQFAYTWSDGTPRVVPFTFHWNGQEFVFGTPPDAPKMQVLVDGTRVALTINTDIMPYKVLLVRGVVRMDIVDGIAPEYELVTRRVLGDEGGQAWLDQMRPICPQMARIFVTPTWVGILDFERRFPSAVERAFEQAHALSKTN
jgi:hypothetical protein